MIIDPNRYLLKLDLQQFAMDPPPATVPKLGGEIDDPKDDRKDLPGCHDQQDPQPLINDERSELIQLRKQAAMAAAGIGAEADKKNMLTHLEGLKDPAEISAKIDAILFELKLGKFQQCADPSPGNRLRQEYQSISYEDIGRKLYHRVRSKKR
ncbi:hypothetical protein [Bacillus sp. UNC438CL73TsuS30]|uniref:hypothetical protein n=1 Tax=Bacillus sp. UNC438CL73TsuS30 TaxID=1340434 RepID=UPI0004793CFB|nr:hypothetical protein [Bacillus sp. UNC438CL73TsuS30]